MDKYKLEEAPTESHKDYWLKAECSKCESTEFEVILTDLCETSVRCLKCGQMDVVHEG